MIHITDIPTWQKILTACAPLMLFVGYGVTWWFVEGRFIRKVRKIYTETRTLPVNHITDPRLQ